MFRTPPRGQFLSQGLRGSVTSRGENLAKEASISLSLACYRAEVLVSVPLWETALSDPQRSSEQSECRPYL